MPARILVVDAEDDVRAVLRCAFTARGHEIAEAADVGTATAAVEQGAVNLVVVDAGMPGGLKFIESTTARLPHVQALAVAAETSIAMAVVAVRSGAFDLIEKPNGLDRVPDAVEDALRHRSWSATAALVRASQLIFSNPHPSKLSEMIVNVAVEVMAADTATLLLPGIDGKLVIAHAHGLPPEVQKTTRITVGQGIAGRVAESRQPTLLNGAVPKTPRPGVVPRPSVRSSIVYPLTSGGRLLGVLTFNRITSMPDYDEHDLAVASVLASQIALALENGRLAQQNVISEKLASVGQLAAGIAHEINTPAQYVGDNTTFLSKAFGGVLTALLACRNVVEAARSGPIDPETLDNAEVALKKARLEMVAKQVPRAIEQSLEGLTRIRTIVGAMKDYSHPSASEMRPENLPDLLETTLTVARNEWKYVASAITELDPDLPPVMCVRDELGQVILNLVVNAAHAIAPTAASGERKGTIVVSTRRDGAFAEIRVRDDGTGIPHHVRHRVFDPFFTTKPVGKGTGQGLAIAHAIVVERHGGTITFESEVGRGTTFLVRIPIAGPGGAEAAKQN